MIRMNVRWVDRVAFADSFARRSESILTRDPGTTARVEWLRRLVDTAAFDSHGRLARNIRDPFDGRLYTAEEDHRLWRLGGDGS